MLSGNVSYFFEAAGARPYVTGLVLLYNPIAPVELGSKPLWSIINIATVVWFWMLNRRTVAWRWS